MEKIAVLMSTYNGQSFLEEQIESILKQEGVKVQLFIRDDGSTDNTVEIINKYKRKHDCISVCKEENKNLGFRDSFLLLLSWALEEKQDIEYFSFSDQDDIWLQDKLSSAVRMIQTNEAEPGLYFSNKTFVDERVQLITEEDFHYCDDFFSLFHNSGASGCTMVFNRKLAEIVSLKKPIYTRYHDLWVYRIARCIKANVYFDKDSHIYYRQHGKNAIGLSGCNQNKHDLSTLFKAREHVLQKSLVEILEAYSGFIDDDIMKHLNDVKRYNTSFKAKFSLATDKQAFNRGIKSYLFWLLTLVREII